MIVAKEQPEKCPKCNSMNFKQDEDVLDTWFSSWLWPFSVFGWPEKTEELEYFLPTNMLVTAPGIIYLWVARMIMSTLEFMDKIPFDTVLLHGMVLDEVGRRMSKSLGNSPDPIDIIDEVGADALRFGMIFNTPKGADSYYSESYLESGRNFANKIWNAFRFMMMNIEKIEGLPNKKELKLELSDKWIYSRLNQVISKVEESYENLRFNDAARILMDFVWKEFCSWYLELSKDRIYNDADKEAQLTAKYILLDILQNSMRMLQPIMPFICEEIWQIIKDHFFIEEESVIIAAFPKADKNLIDDNINNEMSLIQDSITAIRNLRKQVNLAPGLEIDILIKVAENSQKELLENYQNYLQKLAKVQKTEIEIDLKKPKSSIAAVVQNIEIYLPLEGLIDINDEIEKLKKQSEKLEKELQKINSKLLNDKFLEKAPESIIKKEREKHEEVKTKLDKTKEILKGLV